MTPTMHDTIVVGVGACIPMRRQVVVTRSPMAPESVDASGFPTPWEVRTGRGPGLMPGPRQR